MIATIGKSGWKKGQAAEADIESGVDTEVLMASYVDDVGPEAFHSSFDDD